MTVLDAPETYRVEFDKDAGIFSDNGKWVVRGPGFFSGGQHATKKKAINAARNMADKGDTIKIMNKNGSHNRTVTFQGKTPG